MLDLIKTCFASISLLGVVAYGQTYDSYLTGSSTDVVTSPEGGVCLMGGASESDEAMVWFLERANGGDVLVLRTSGSDGYNDYMYTDLGVSLNSVETIVCNSAAASDEAYLHDKISKAEAIWFAGGDQWDYISYWRNTPVDSLINLGIKDRNIVIGGTSAGMAIQGKYYFSAENGTVTSATALANPYHPNVTVDSSKFIVNEYLEDVVTDTHYDSPDRKGRHTVFLSRILEDYGVVGKGIACDEYTAVCITETGLAIVFGNYPTYDDNAYFIQPNCELSSFNPETCTSGSPLEWNHGGQALKVFVVKGTLAGINTFNLANWSVGGDGSWQTWHVDSGTLYEDTSTPINCLGSIPSNQIQVSIYPNPSEGLLTVNGIANGNYMVFDLSGKEVKSGEISADGQLDLSDLKAGYYQLRLVSPDQLYMSTIVLK